jgi:transcriptional/translational regulatory protein YebC/TACO1
MGSAGNVAWMFERKGLLVIEGKAADEDKLMEIALEAGADDFKSSGPHFEIICDPAHFNKVQEALAKHNVATTTAEITQLPKTPREVDGETGKKVLKLMDALDDHDDVQNVYSDMHVTEELMAAAAAGD